MARSCYKGTVQERVKHVVRRIVGLALAVSSRLFPLMARRQIVAWLGRNQVPYGDWLSIELLRDFADRDPAACHRFLWAHHLAYAQTYSVEQRFGPERVNQSRHLLFDELHRFLVAHGIRPERDVDSVLEVGCSLGYLLRHLELGLFRSARTLEGIDIDRRAIEQGSQHLQSIGSRVRLSVADMSELDEVLRGRTVDVILCAGVLLYLPEEGAREVVRSLLRHTRVVAVFSGLAHPVQDNSTLASSTIRRRDATFIHDIDGMVRDAGGQVAWRRWDGPRVIEGNTIYFVFASPGISGLTARDGSPARQAGRSAPTAG